MSRLLPLIDSVAYLNTKRKYANLTVSALVLTLLAVILDYKFVSDIVIFLVILLLGFPVLFIVSKIGSVVFPLVSTKPYPYGVFELKKCYQQNFGLAVIIAGLLFVMPIWGYKFLTKSPPKIEGRDRVEIPIATDTVIIDRGDYRDTLVVHEAPPSISDPVILERIVVDIAKIGIPTAVPETTTVTVAAATQKELQAYHDSLGSIVIVRLGPALVLRDYEIRGTACPGKDIKIVVFVVNNGGEVKNLTGRLFSLHTNPRVKVDKKTESFKFGTMSKSESKNNKKKPFRVTIPNTVKPGDVLEFQLSLTAPWKSDEGYLIDTTFTLQVSQCGPPPKPPSLEIKEIYMVWWRDPVRALIDKGQVVYIGGGQIVQVIPTDSSATIYCDGQYHKIKFDLSAETIVDWTKSTDFLKRLSQVFMENYCTDYPNSQYCVERRR